MKCSRWIFFRTPINFSYRSSYSDVMIVCCSVLAKGLDQTYIDDITSPRKRQANTEQRVVSLSITDIFGQSVMVCVCVCLLWAFTNLAR